MDSLGQKTRLIALFLYIGLLFCASKLALGSWLPPTTQKGLWFYSGLAALLLGNLIITPYYTKPADAISNAVASLVGLLAVNIWASPTRISFDKFVWTITTTYVVIILATSILAIVLKDASRSFWQKASRSFFVLSNAIGSPRAVFSVVFLFALATFHRDRPREYLVIGLAWALTVALRPFEAAFILFHRMWQIWRRPKFATLIGSVVGHEAPGIVMIRERADSQVLFGDGLAVASDNGKCGLAVAMDRVGFAEGRWLRALHLSLPKDAIGILEKLNPTRISHEFLAMQVDPSAFGIQPDLAGVWSRRDDLVGFVAAETSLSRLVIEVVRTDFGLEEGRLLEVKIGSTPVLYQIINGLTREEILQQKNTRGFVKAEAKKIGSWSADLRRFETVKWVPQPNAPVFLVKPAAVEFTKEMIGHFPGTNYPVTIDPDLLVTHNCAILGILGAGKSFLTLELVERIIGKGIKVICLDLTNQYAQELAPYYDRETEDAAAERLKTIGADGKNNVQRNVEEGGSIQQFAAALKEDLEAFLDPADDRRLKIYNPLAFEVWRQDSKPFQDRASMASLTPTEITRIIAETILEILQSQGMSDDAKCCLVFEEAHSLIPEWNAVASEGDKTATNGTAKAILQGRKYGLGCFVITQRTANVTKSILNQCNTVFALRVFDATGMEFLKNYIGEDYSAVLSTLEDRHAVVFGRASSCRNPVLIRLNDREDFLRIFRADEALPAEAVAGGVAIEEVPRDA
ncbi:MAG TPA: DUF87 domain-containing protein [Pyrinomonadaceae bacterium]|nr:DUF87 domain-containing protein [Pyrinomonadaceae bacterium]